MLNLLIMGKPGAGKGTQSTRLLDYYRLKHISTGNVYREEIQKRSAIGIEAEQYILRGELVPDDLTNEIVKEILQRRDLSQRLYARRVSADRGASRRPRSNACGDGHAPIRGHQCRSRRFGLTGTHGGTPCL
jgi:dephospho-CoA kinase